MNRALIVFTGLLAAGVLVGSVRVSEARPRGQDQTSAGGTSIAAKPKPKKVWTNDDVSEMTGTISVVGTPTPQRSGKTQGSSSISSFQQTATTKPGQNKGADAAKSGDGGGDPKMLAQLRQQLQKLQASIDTLDKQIEQLKGVSRGDSKNVGGLNPDTWSYSTASIPDQIKSLEAKRSALQTSMDNLLDAARASGIEPGQLR